MRARAALLAAGAWLLVPLAARATEGPDHLSGEIVVTGRGGAMVEDVGTTETVTAQDIRIRGARTLDEAIALLPGVQLRLGADGAPRIQVRGLETRHVRFLLDGVPLNSPFDGNFDPTTIPAEIIARITFTKGASSVLYGDGALAGVVNIVTREGRGPAHLTYAGAETGSGQHERYAASAAGAAGAADYFLAASRLRRAAFVLSGDFMPTPLQPAGHRVNSDFRRESFLGSLGLRPASALAVRAVVSHLDGDQGIPPTAIDATRDPFATRLRFERLDHQIRDTQQVVAELMPDGPWSARGWLFHTAEIENDDSFDDARFATIADPTKGTTFLERDETRVTGGHAQASYDAVAGGTVTAGLDLRREAWEDGGVIRDVPLSGSGGGRGRGGGGGTFGLRSLSDRRRLGVGSAELEYAVAPLAGLRLTAGAAHHRQQRDDAPDDSRGGYMAGVTWDAAPSTRLRAAVSRQVRFPTIRQLYDPTNGNLALRSESANDVEWGVVHRLPGGVRLTGALFRDTVHDYIENDETTNRLHNFDQYRFEGAEASADMPLGPRAGVRAAYTYVSSRNNSRDAATSVLQYRPRHNASLQAWWAGAGGWRIYGSAQWIGDEAALSRAAPIQTTSLPGYGLVSLRVAKSLGSTGLSVFAGADNLLDRDYQTSYGFPQAGRFVFAGIEYAP